MAGPDDKLPKMSPMPAPAKKENFSETMWFKDGAEAEEEDLSFDEDFELERVSDKDRYARKDLSNEERSKFSLNKETKQ